MNTSKRNIRKYLSIDNYRVFLSILITILMLSLPCWLFFKDITLSTHFEESIGFRYIHSLRLLYGNEGPWLPQGQLPGILHIFIQKVLTLTGHPQDELFPRVDLFSFWAVVIPLFMTGFVYAWTVKPLKTFFLQSIFAIAFLACFFSPRFQDGWMLLPDYHIWMVPLSIIAIGWTIRSLSTNNIFRGFTTKDAVLLGVYAGACLSVKVTLFTYPLALGLMFLILDKKLKTLSKLACISGPLALLTWSTVLVIYYQGNFSILPEHFKTLANFTDSQVQLIRADSLKFFEIFVPITLLDLFYLIPAMVFFSVWSIKNNKLKSIASVLLPVSLFELYMLYQRNYTHTNVEVQYLFFIVGAMLTICLFQQSKIMRHGVTWINNNLNNPGVTVYKTSILIALIIPILIHTNYSLSRMDIFTAWIKELNIAGQGLHKAIADNPGNTMFLIPITASVDEFNLRTIDNGLFKSATGLSPFWDKDSYVAKLYSNRWVASNRKTLKDIAEFQNIVFRTDVKENLEYAIARLQFHYKQSFNDFNCLKPYFMFTIPTEQTLVICTRNQQL